MRSSTMSEAEACCSIVGTGAPMALAPPPPPLSFLGATPAQAPPPVLTTPPAALGQYAMADRLMQHDAEMETDDLTGPQPAAASALLDPSVMPVPFAM